MSALTNSTIRPWMIPVSAVASSGGNTSGSRLRTDVPVSSVYCRWIKELVNRGITAGCGNGNFCPDTSVTRGSMSVFLATTFQLIVPAP